MAENEVYWQRLNKKECIFKDIVHIIWLLVDLKVLGIKGKGWIVVSSCTGRTPIE